MTMSSTTPPAGNSTEQDELTSMIALAMVEKFGADAASVIDGQIRNADGQMRVSWSMVRRKLK